MQLRACFYSFLSFSFSSPADNFVMPFSCKSKRIEFVLFFWEEKEGKRCEGVWLVFSIFPCSYFFYTPCRYSALSHSLCLSWPNVSKSTLVKSLLFIISLPSSSASLALFELATCRYSVCFFFFRPKIEREKERARGSENIIVLHTFERRAKYGCTKTVAH